VNQKSGNHLDDKQLVEKILHGQTHAFDIIIKGTQGLVTQIVCRMIANVEDRKDIAQDVYLSAFGKLASFRFQSKISTWIAQIAYNKCLSYLEKKKLVLPGIGNLDEEGYGEGLEKLQEKSTDLTSMSIENVLFKKESVSILNTAIDQLSPVYRTMVVLYHQEERSYEEIAQITELPVGTVKSYLFRARKALKDNLLSKYKREEL